jgi:hypothetical protein
LFLVVVHYVCTFSVLWCVPSVDMLICWYVDMLICWYDVMLLCWYDVLVFCCFAVLLLCCYDVMLLCCYAVMLLCCYAVMLLCCCDLVQNLAVLVVGSCCLVDRSRLKTQHAQWIRKEVTHHYCWPLPFNTEPICACRSLQEVVHNQFSHISPSLVDRNR